MKRFIDFKRDEDGAVTVDWVLLTASVAILCTAVTVLVSNSSVGLSNDVSIYMDSRDPN